SSAGMLRWDIGSVSHLSQQWFWFRNSLDGYNGREYSLDEISAASVNQILPNIARIKYAEPRLSIDVTYLLVSGAGLASADITEIVKIANLTDDEITFSFFQYSNFDLGGDADDDSIEITGGNTVLQSDGGGHTLSETVVSNHPDLSEVGVAPATLAKLTDGDANDLDGTASIMGPSDLTWAFEWKDRVIGGRETLVITKDKLIASTPIPEPGPAALLTFALAGMARTRRRA
ncbi:MAG: hypothetical protein ABIF82_04475, partial [Planctomycetota bacterium]